MNSNDRPSASSFFSHFSIDILFALFYNFHVPHGNSLPEGVVVDVGYYGDCSLEPNIKHKRKKAELLPMYFAMLTTVTFREYCFLRDTIQVVSLFDKISCRFYAAKQQLQMGLAICSFLCVIIIRIGETKYEEIS